MNNLTKAENALKSRKYKLALRLFRALVNDEPSNALARQGLAQALLRTQAHDEALAESKNAIKLDPNLSLPYVIMAYAYYSKKDFEAFRCKAHEAYELDPASADVLTCYGIMLLIDKDLDRAINTFMEAVRINPADMVARANLAYTYSIAGNVKESFNQTKQVFLISPSISTAFRLLSAFHEVHARVFGILLVLSTAAALFLRSNFLLWPAVIYAAYALWVGCRLILMKKWKLGLFGVGYAVLLAIMAALVYGYIQ